MPRVTLLLLAIAFSMPSFVSAQSAVEAAPGLPFPVLGSVAFLDATLSPEKLVVVHSHDVKFNAHAGGNFARSMVYSGPKSGVELAGEHAPVAIHGSTPTLFVHLSSDDPDTQRRHLTLLRLQPTKSGREVAQFTANIFGGSRKRIDEVIPVTMTDVEGSVWIKVSPSQPLVSGEYAIAFVPEAVVSFADTVYDFTVAASK